jgi:hypothetical protein
LVWTTSCWLRIFAPFVWVSFASPPGVEDFRMVRRAVPLLLPIALLAGGCFGDEKKTVLVPDSPFNAPVVAPPVMQASYAPAPTEQAARVDSIGRSLLAANPQLGVRPLFRTVGSPNPEIFHVNTTEIIITAGLVNQCGTDAQLAAVLCSELGKMVSERESLAQPWNRKQERLPPMDVRITGDSGMDQTRLAEMAQYEQDRKRNVNTAGKAPDAKVLAVSYLTKAGYAESDLEAVAPLLQAAATHNPLEKQLKAPPPPARPWTQ